jgi:pyridoxal phosphate enzyme (YggS family)
VALGTRQAAVAEHHACAGRQAVQCREQGVADPLVGHQPGVATGVAIAVQIAHRPAIAARMTPATPSAAASPLASVTTGIAHAARLAQREPADITLIAVSKTHGADAIRPLLAAGQRVFGENRVAEAAAKWPELRNDYPGVALHLIGQLQSNKAEDAVALFDAIHAVDRPSLVDALGKAMVRTGRRPDCFVQVNIGAEEQKGGCAIAELPTLLEQARAAGLPVAGLMCIPPADVEPAPYFALLAKLAREARLEGLSMGMSSDYETAVTLGATHVRVGSALFGARA